MSDDTKNPHILKASEAHYEDTDISRNDKLRLKAEAAAIAAGHFWWDYMARENIPDQAFVAGYLAHAAEAEELVKAIDELEEWAKHAHMLGGPIAKCVRLLAKYRGGTHGK